MPSLSVCIITLNEEANLGRCLNSVRPIADEIIIVDSGSTDRTNFIATEFNARFIRQDWLGYGAQKNFAIAKAKHDWVLSIDADEALSSVLQESIATWKQSEPTGSLSGYEVSRVVCYQDRWIRFGDWYPDYLVRLFRRDRARFSDSAVHERLELNGEVQRLEGELEHHSFVDEADYLARAERYSSLWAAQSHSEGKRSTAGTALTHALWRFMRGYLLRGGWKGGSLGLKLSLLQAREVALKHRKLAALGKKTK